MTTLDSGRVVFGPAALPDVTHVQHQTTTVLSFVTDHDAAARLMPPWFRPTEEPVVSITHQVLEGVDYMRGGRGYRLLNVAISAVFDSDRGVLTGPSPVVIWESDTTPIIAGRELHGNPKIYGDVSGLEEQAGGRVLEVREHGALLARGTVAATTALPEERLGRLNASAADSTFFGWKLVPGPGGIPDVDYPTLIHASAHFDQAWSGPGSVEFATPSDEQAPYSWQIVAALRDLPQLSVRPAFVGEGTATLFRNRTERLRPAGS